MDKDFERFMNLIELSHDTSGTDWIYNRRLLRLHLRAMIEKSVLNVATVNEANRDVCPRCGSEDIVTTIYCNKCNKAM